MEEIKLDEKEKKKNPYDRANIVSELLFCWLLPYFKKGYSRELTEDDMYRHRNKHDSSKLGDLLERAWKKEIINKKSPSLINVLLKIFSVEIVFLNLFILITECLKIVQPLLISKLMRLYQSVDMDDMQLEIYLYALLVVIMSFLSILLTHYFNIQMSQVALKMRVACSSLIYRKTLKLSEMVLVETTIGQMVNLLSNDVGRFDLAFHHIHQFWLGPLLTCIVIYLTYSTYGWVGTSGVILLIICMPIQMYLGRKNSQFRYSTAIRTDERVRLMNEIINGIQVIKMYTWEKSFAKIVEIARKYEMKYIKSASRVRGILMSMTLSNSRASIALSIITYIATGNTLTSTYVYTITSFYRILNTFTMFFPQAVSIASELYTSLQRIQVFLELEERKIGEVNKGFVEKFTTLPEELKPLNEINKQKLCFKLDGVSAKWVKSHPENTLDNVSLNVDTGDLVALVGPVGSGKSSLLHVILQELEPSEGYSEVIGKISYASQEPWLFGGSIRQNILFGQPYDEEKYKEVVKVCALQRDFSLLSHGDKTRIGERGVTLSGGQRARVNLARAVYKEADLYLLDDPLSAVDTHVGKQLFEECICKYLAGKTVVLVTHQLQYLKHLNNIVLLDNGKITASGSYLDITNSSSIFTKLLKDLEKEDEDKNKTKNTTVANIENKGEDETPALQKEEKGVGKVTSYVYKSYIRAGGHICKIVLLSIGFVLSQTFDSFSEYFIKMWVNIEQMVLKSNIIRNTHATLSLKYRNITTNGSVATDPYQIEDDWIVNLFTGTSTVYIYGAIVMLLFIVTFSRSILFFLWCIKASTVMHNKMFDNIIYSPMQFFNVNPSGRILNRFSKDIGVIDEMLPTTILDTIQIGLCVLSVCLVIGTLSPWVFIPTLVVLITFYFMRVVFLETSRDVKRVESIKRSPIYSHLTASLQGLTTIRAFKAQELLVIEFDKLQNLHSAAFFMYLGVTRSFGFWLDFFCVIYIGMVLFVLLFIKGETFGGNVGLALTQAMTLTGMFQWGIRQWSELENQMTSVERIQEYADLSPEAEKDVWDPPDSWPEWGQIVFNKLSLRYAQTLPYVLKDLTFAVNPKEKIGVVGRTGAGKSSLIQALFRLTNVEGSIIIDGIDTKTIPLNKLRSKISIIPQEPVLFSGTLRKNLDPFDEYPDELIWTALEEVELKQLISDLPDGLDNKMSEGGHNFSVGQRQLICLARAIVRQNKILILDEATANVDLHTDGLIQKTIRKKFADCTVITVAHRLHTIMDSDKVLVMDAGEILEYDIPYLLLQNKTGIFYSLLMQTGTSTANNLISVAEEAYNFRQAIVKNS